MNKTKILVTGGAGFIGSHLCERLAKNSENEVYSLDNYFTEPIIVNLSFSIELYLKCLNTKSTYSKKDNTDLPILERKLETIYGHKFDEIFKKLKPAEQENLSFHWCVAILGVRISLNGLTQFAFHNNNAVTHRMPGARFGL